jgi:hypothetical protein
MRASTLRKRNPLPAELLVPSNDNFFDDETIRNQSTDGASVELAEPVPITAEIMWKSTMNILNKSRNC